ncbi:Protein still life, isoform SIF type 1 [Halotydeus destructor]|nr:Protein still life, isoform SIF type 1 [Halotydeus destructor]
MLNDKSATGSGKKERSQSPTIKILQEYESHLRNALAKGADADTYSLNTFETILSQSMENVVALMKEVQSEIEAIRREESHFRSTGDDIGGSCSPFSLHHHHHGRAASTTGRPHWARSYTLPSRGTSLPPCGLTGSSTGDLYGSTRKGSAPVLDTLSVDGMLPASCLRTQSSFESTDSKCYLTSSELCSLD